MATRKSNRARRSRADDSTIRLVDPNTWPVYWRVVAPACGSYDYDITFLETESEDEADDELRKLRCAGYTVRLERVQCGPLPVNAVKLLADQRAKLPQNPGTTMRPVLGLWTLGVGGAR